MAKSIKTVLMTLAALIFIDVAVASFLSGPAPASLQRFFDYGTSVPGKIEKMKLQDADPGGLLELAWLDRMIADSATAFAAEPDDSPPVMRVYGMSFAADIAKGAQTHHPALVVDIHAGPNAPPNFAYEAFLRDRPNRRQGDIVVLAILSASVPAMSSFSNRTWAFEQPAPFTYPVFDLADDGGLLARHPVLTTLEQENSLLSDPELAAEWARQLHQDDRLYTPAAFDLPVSDHSPFLRLMRRAQATRAIERKKAAMIADLAGYPYPEVLRRMFAELDRITRTDGQFPVVLLIQSRDPHDVDLHALLADGLDRLAVPYLSTATIAPVSDHSAFIADGHYTAETNLVFGRALLDMIGMKRLEKTTPP